MVDLAVGRAAALDQRDGKAERASQARFLACHFSRVGFMIVAGQVQQTVQDEDLQLVVGGVSQAAGIACGDLRRDGKIAGETPTTKTRRQRGF